MDLYCRVQCASSLCAGSRMMSRLGISASKLLQVERSDFAPTVALGLSADAQLKLFN
jgi:hypothetical protein